MKSYPQKMVFAGGAVLASIATALLLTITAGAAPRGLAPLSQSPSSYQPLDQSSPEVAQAVNAAKGLSVAFRAVSERLLPAVVAIETGSRVVDVDASDAPREGVNPWRGTPFEELFEDGQLGQKLRPPRRQRQGQAGMGSGVIIDPAGVVMTNNHVVRGGGDITVRLQDGREFKAVDVWTDPKTDIALVKIDASGLVAARLGDSDQVAIGDWVLALGQPFGLESTVTAGIISGMHRGIGITDRENFLQTDAAINPGNSGGPLVNLDGDVIGINTAISSRSGGNNGVGFAVPINLAKWVSGQLANGGEVHRAYLGVGIQQVTAELAEQFNVNPREGVVVTHVIPDTPAAKAGIRPGDVILEFNGVTIHGTNELQLRVEQTEIGRPHPVVVVRDGRRTTLQFTPERQPEEFGLARMSPEQRIQPNSSDVDQLGFGVSELDSAVARRLGVPVQSGVVITTVESGSHAARAGLRSGDVITHVNRRPIASVADLKEQVNDSDPGTGILLLIHNSRGSRFVVLQS